MAPARGPVLDKIKPFLGRLKHKGEVLDAESGDKP